ncbi:TPA: efflux transporter periplasmic adaptor subunit, partial [Burkholderia territorii]|nr:efflux transporter periplasmic adaptor subunit [Burkholderia territorii]
VLDEVPDDFRMIAGRTATVAVRSDTRRNDNAKPAAGASTAAVPPATSAALAGSATGASQ